MCWLCKIGGDLEKELALTTSDHDRKSICCHVYEPIVIQKTQLSAYDANQTPVSKSHKIS